jgi:hypothetical protein
MFFICVPVMCCIPSLFLRCLQWPKSYELQDSAGVASRPEGCGIQFANGAQAKLRRSGSQIEYAVRYLEVEKSCGRAMQASGIHALELVLLLLLVFVVLFAALARKLQTPYPIVLVIAGLFLSFIPGIPKITLNHRCDFSSGIAAASLQRGVADAVARIQI